MCRLYIIKIFRKSHGVYVLYVHSWDYGRGSDGMRPQTHARNGASRMIIYICAAVIRPLLMQVEIPAGGKCFRQHLPHEDNFRKLKLQ